MNKPKKAPLVDSRAVNDYFDIHPALDFTMGNAITSVGTRWLRTYEDDSVDFDEVPLCILSNGDSFEYSKEELARRGFFYKGLLDVPFNRWEYKDIEKFTSNPDSREIKDIYYGLRETFNHYIELSDERLYSLLSCFVIYTYFFPIFNSAPILHFWGEFQTGKTKLCSLLEATTFNPINSSNLSGATMFRQVQAGRSVILLDESEDLSSNEKSKDVRNMLLAGTGKFGKAYRQEKSTNDNFKTATFEVFSPKVIAHIEGIDLPALSSRLIRVPTKYAKSKEKLNRDVELTNEKWANIRNHLYRMCLCKYKEVLSMNQELPSDGFSGRTLQIWRGIFTIGALVDRKTLEELQSYASTNKEYIDSDTEFEKELPVSLIENLLMVLDSNNNEELYSSNYLMDTIGIKMGYQNKKALGGALSRLGFYSKVHKIEGKNKRLYTLKREELEKLFEQ